MLLCPQQPCSHGEGWCLQWWAQEEQAGTAQRAPPGVPRHRWLPQAAWKNATVSRKPGLALRPAGPGTSRAWGEPHEVVFKAAVIPKMCPHTCHPKHCDLLGSNPARHESHEKQLIWTPWAFSSPTWRRLDQEPGAGQNRQRSHCDSQCGCSKSWSCPCWCHCAQGTRLGGWHIFHVLLHPHS